jgi:type III secretion protein Q
VPLPFELPAISRGFAALSPAAAQAGGRAAEAAARAVGSLLGRDVAVRARAMPGVPGPRPASARVALDLTALPGAAALEIDPGFVAALVDVLAGGPGAASPATALTPIEASALELFALCALDGACSVAAVEDALAPRLSRAAGDPPSALAVELDLTVGAIAGRGRLLLPAGALRAMDRPAVDEAIVPLPVSVRSGRAPLTAAELEALAEGDVVLLDAPGESRDALVLPGGTRFTGRLRDDCFEVEEVTTMERSTNVSVLLEVELARLEVPLSEIARLQPGAALPLAIDRRGLVTLRVGDRTVARGELVDIDGVVGVRVLGAEGAP